MNTIVVIILKLTENLSRFGIVMVEQLRRIEFTEFKYMPDYLGQN